MPIVLCHGFTHSKTPIADRAEIRAGELILFPRPQEPPTHGPGIRVSCQEAHNHRLDFVRRRSECAKGLRISVIWKVTRRGRSLEGRRPCC